MTLKEALAKLKSLGNEKTRAHHKKNGADDKLFGVPMGDIRKVAATIKTDHDLALALWETGNLDARLLAILILKPKSLSAVQLDKMVRSAAFGWLADWFNSYVVKEHPEKEALREKWMADKDPWAARAGWSLTAGRIARSPEGLDLDAILDASRNPPERRRAARAVDDEQLPCRHRDPSPEASQAGPSDRGTPRRLPRFSRVQGLHLAFRAHLDQRDGAPAGVIANRPILSRRESDPGSFRSGIPGSRIAWPRKNRADKPVGVPASRIQRRI